MVKDEVFPSYQKKLKKELDADRYEHTIGVAYTAAALAMRYGGNIQQAQVAGLLHDCAKCIPNQKKITLCQKYNIKMTEIELKNPFLPHAKLGAFLAMHKYGITDKEITSAILNHTTGKPNMSLLDKIIFVADYIEPQRKKQPNLAEIRKLAFIDLDRALLRILEDTLAFLSASADNIDPMTEKTYRYYKDLLDKKQDA
jgi:predicted HD superfamily hydrolase involved in NAD metabolism